MKNRRFSYDVPIGIFLVAFAAIFYAESFKIRNAASARVPRLLLLMLGILGLVILLGGLRKTFRPKETDPVEALSFDVYKHPLFVYVLILLYIVLLTYTNFIVSTLIFIPLTMLYYGSRNWKQIVIVTASTTILVYFMFSVVLKVVMP